jgi:AcrR family transcriptional regulator
MGVEIDTEAQTSPASDGKAPRTARGERTLRKILDAARDEFGERGFSESSIVGITQRAGVALGTFYTYFDSKEAVFRALVRDMSAQVRDHVAPALGEAEDAIDAERRALQSFLEFARKHRDVYRIAARLCAGRDRGEISPQLTEDDLEILAWAMMGANVFLGLRFAVWSSADAKRVAEVTSRLLRSGLKA